MSPVDVKPMDETIEKYAAVDIECTDTAPNAPKGLFKRWHQKACQVKWFNVAILSTLHILCLVGVVYFMLKHTINLRTVAFAYLIGAFSGLGMSVGGHRLWAHRSFKARLPLRLFLVIFQAMTMNGSAFSYARDHRTHHKYSDTEGDPKNPSRGLFYSHIGWWMLKKSQKVKDHGNKLDFSDLKEDWVVWYQHRFYTPIFLLFGVIIPVSVPYFFWNENLLSAFFVCFVFRTTMVLHHLFTVNSLAHFFGHRPYDYRIRPTENRLVAYLSFGEGNHNFHHTFAYDYTSSGKQVWESFNPSSLLIDFCKLLGQAYDCKRASLMVIEGTIKRKGIPAHFDPPRKLCFRITNGLFDWTAGTLLELWPVVVGVVYQLIIGHTIFVY